MANNIRPEMQNYPSGYANYANLILKEINPYYELAILGKDAHNMAIKINQKYVPNKLFLGSFVRSEIELLKNKYVEGSTMIYICENKTCQIPTSNVSRAKKLML